MNLAFFRRILTYILIYLLFLLYFRHLIAFFSFFLVFHSFDNRNSNGYTVVKNKLKKSIFLPKKQRERGKNGYFFKPFPVFPFTFLFVCDDSRNIVYAKHNIICRKATSFSDRKRKRYLRLWRKMVFLPAVGNTTLRVVVPLPPREG